jgi:hypothetical protein
VWTKAARELAPVVAAGALLLAVFGNPLVGGRSYFAFSQHYAINAAEARRLPEDPWLEYRSIAEAAFGRATTVGQALLANPREFAWQLLWNASHLDGLRMVLAPAMDVPRSAARAVATALWAAVASGLLLAAARMRRPSSAGRTGRVLALGIAAAAVPAGSAMLLIQPEPSYALPLILPVLVLGAWGLSVRARRRRPSPRRLAALAALAVVLLAALPGRQGVPWWLGARGSASTPNTTLVRFLARLPVLDASPLLVMGYWGLGGFARWNSRPVSYLECTPFAACVRDRRVDVVVPDPAMASYYSRLGDRDFEAFLAAPAAWGFVGRVAPEPSGTQVLVRSDRLRPGPP